MNYKSIILHSEEFDGNYIDLILDKIVSDYNAEIIRGLVVSNHNFQNNLIDLLNNNNCNTDNSFVMFYKKHSCFIYMDDWDACVIIKFPLKSSINKKEELMELFEKYKKLIVFL